MKLTEEVAEIEDLFGSPRGVISGGRGGGGVEEPAVGSTHGVVRIRRLRRALC